MPFQSERQRRYLWLKHPDIARRWTETYGPVAVNDKKTSSRRRKKKGK